MKKHHRPPLQQNRPPGQIAPPRTQPPAQITASFAAFQGPLPPPSMLERYGAVIPNGAERIMALAERQQQHRQELEAAVVHGNVVNERRGQTRAFILGLVAIVGGIGLIAFDKDVQGLTAIIATFASLAGVFIYGRWQQAQERKQKRRDAQDAAAQPSLPYEDR